MQTELIIISGPTASGKSKLAVILAEKISAEIVSADSRQIYKFMDIGAAKPSPEDIMRVPHHMIDIITPDTVYSAGEYKNEARKIIDEILNKKKKVIMAGGTGLYMRAVLYDISTYSSRDDKIRKELEKIIEEKGSEYLYEQLKQVDPDTAKKIHFNDKVRLIRALEIHKLTGLSASSLRT
ncbi:tRNA (adenosine(37)-N6)-dimethylallyltransferase MiaA, partial [Candidatus Desantisbacteria bacterium]|nr:tRNA (adenosine(37)-N6)-dimethylallyltransferase MiaA [Candidatus Desantisbacteria bacterium]